MPGPTGPTGGVGPTGPAGADGATGPTGPSINRDSHTFSQLSVALAGAPTDIYMAFSGGMAGPVAGFTGTMGTLALLGIGAEKFAVAAGFAGVDTVWRSSIALTVDVFVEISTGGGAFARTVVAAGVALAPGVPLLIAGAPVPFIPTDIVRVGIVATSVGTIITDLTAEYAISF